MYTVNSLTLFCRLPDTYEPIEAFAALRLQRLVLVIQNFLTEPVAPPRFVMHDILNGSSRSTIEHLILVNYGVPQITPAHLMPQVVLPSLRTFCLGGAFTVDPEWMPQMPQRLPNLRTLRIELTAFVSFRAAIWAPWPSIRHLRLKQGPPFPIHRDNIPNLREITELSPQLTGIEIYVTYLQFRAVCENVNPGVGDRLRDLHITIFLIESTSVLINDIDILIASSSQLERLTIWADSSYAPSEGTRWRCFDVEQYITSLSSGSLF